MRGEARESVGEGDAAGEVEDGLEPDAVAELGPSLMSAKVTPSPSDAVARRLCTPFDTMRLLLGPGPVGV